MSDENEKELSEAEKAEEHDPVESEDENELEGDSEEESDKSVDAETDRKRKHSSNKSPTKKSKKFKASRMFDEEAELESDESGMSDDEDEEEDDEDLDEFEEDDFVVRDEDIAKGKKKKRSKEEREEKREKRRLQKKPPKRRTADEEDLQLIQENQRDEFQNQSLHTLDVGDKERRGAGGDGNESDINDFIEQDSEDEGDMDREYHEGPERLEPRGARYLTAQQKAAQRGSLGAAMSTDKIKEAMEIFGEEFVMDEEEDYYEDEERELQRRAQEQQAALLSGTKSAFEYMDMVENFLLPADKQIVALDVPERFQQYFTEGAQRMHRSRDADRALDESSQDAVLLSQSQDIFNTQSSFVAHSAAAAKTKTSKKSGSSRGGDGQSGISDEERLAEARWIAQQLVRSCPSLRPLPAEELVRSVESVLRQFQEEHLEVPFLWQYRRDQFHASLTRSVLWQCFTLDMRWCRLQYEIGVTARLLAVLDDALRQVFSAKEAEQLFHGRYCTDLLETAEDEETVRDIRRFALLTLSLVNRERERKRADKTSRPAKPAAKSSSSSSAANGDDSQYFEEEKEERDLFDEEDKEEEEPLPESQDADAEEEFAEESKAGVEKEKELKKSSIRNSYIRFKSLPKVREFISHFTLPIHEIGTAFRYDYPVSVPQTGALSASALAEELVKEKVFLKASAALKAVKTVLSTELAAEPSLRGRLREIFRETVSVSTVPTEAGLHAITPFSTHFGLQFIEKKPLREFFASREGLLQFMHMVDAEQQGFLKIKFVRPHMDLLMTVFGKFLPPAAADFDEEFPEARKSWDLLRAETIDSTIHTLLLPSLEKEMRRELTRLGKDAVIDECAANFEALLRVGPFLPPLQGARKDECDRALAALNGEDIPPPWTRNDCERVFTLLRETPRRAKPRSVAAFYLSQEGRNSGLHMVVVDSEGSVVAYREIPAQAMSEKKDKIESFLYDSRPELILLNSAAGVMARSVERLIMQDVLRDINETIRLQINNSKSDAMQVDDDEEEERNDEDLGYQPTILIMDDTLASNFKSSRRAKMLLPSLPGPACAAVSLCRFALEPLAEYANLWKTANPNGVFGFEATFLSLHPLQKHVEGFTAKFVRALEFKLVDAVADCGVDVRLCLRHDHHAAMLAFVPGLGVRKADALRRALIARQTAGGSGSGGAQFSLSSRQMLKDKALLGECVFANAAGFLRIFPATATDQEREWHPLDNTRIHPHCYVDNDFAQLICCSALDQVNVPEKAVAHIQLLMQGVKKEFLKRVGKHPALLLTWMEGKPDLSIAVDFDGYMMTIPDKALRDMLSNLDMNDFVRTLVQSGHARNPLLMEMIKEELRFPFLDLRRPVSSISAQRMFEIVSGENEQSLYVGRTLGFTVLRHLEGGGAGQHPGDVFPHTALVSTDIPGINGRISKFEVVDEEPLPRDLDISQYLPIGAQGVAVVVGINYDRMSVQLSVKPHYLAVGETWWIRNRTVDRNMCEYLKARNIDANRMFDVHFQLDRALMALDEMEKKREAVMGKVRLANAATMAAAGQSSTMSAGGGRAGVAFSRVIVHPLFANVDARGAEDRLNREGALPGAVVFRPSSSGWDQLTLTWAFQPGLFKHIRIKEKDKQPGEMKICDKLFIEEEDMQKDRFHDIDDIHANFVEQLNGLVERMVNYTKFKRGTPDEVKAYLFDLANRNPGVIPYCVRFEPEKPRFMWVWLSLQADGNHAVKNMAIDVHFKGYKVGGRYFNTPQEIANWFKASYQSNLERSAAQRNHIEALNLSGNYFAAPAAAPSSSSAAPRRTRFSSAAAPTSSASSQQGAAYDHYGSSSNQSGGHYGPGDEKIVHRSHMVPPPPPPRVIR